MFRAFDSDQRGSEFEAPVGRHLSLDLPKSNRPERRMAVVALEYVRYKVDITAINEAQFSEQSQLEGVGADYAFFWSGTQRRSKKTRISPLPSRMTS
ncbi:unnamed protein product [Dibothriocephalus latus]|uniref:Uncharacterized protein n=1 Tax=Dibothriocephalus latus TaxID=60516 RepID=A0A3P7MFK2_DIBLA|nr:unnamed protein product [Dibothriocephalus latus]